jgi:hypothetical protein
MVMLPPAGRLARLMLRLLAPRVRTAPVPLLLKVVKAALLPVALGAGHPAGRSKVSVPLAQALTAV